MEFLEKRIVRTFEIRLAEITICPKLGIDERPTGAARSIRRQTSLPAQEIIPRIFVAILVQEAVVHVAVHAVGREISKLLVRTPDGKHGAPRFALIGR